MPKLQHVHGAIRAVWNNPAGFSGINQHLLVRLQAMAETGYRFGDFSVERRSRHILILNTTNVSLEPRRPAIHQFIYYLLYWPALPSVLLALNLISAPDAGRRLLYEQLHDHVILPAAICCRKEAPTSVILPDCVTSSSSSSICLKWRLRLWLNINENPKQPGCHTR